MNEDLDGKGVETGKEYLKILKKLLVPKGRILLERFVFDKEDLHLMTDGIKPYLLNDKRLLEICGDDLESKEIDVLPLKVGEKLMNATFPFKINLTYSLLTRKLCL